MIYFIKHTDYVKIGYTDNIMKRLSQLQVSSPIRLNLLGLIEGNLNDEAFYHEKFKSKNSNGEWFKYDEEISKYIENLDKKLMWEHGFENHVSNPIGVIKSCRLQKNMSLEELGDLIGISKQAILDMEKREINGSITIKAINKALNAMGYKFQYRAIN